MNGWRTWNVGDAVQYVWNDLDGRGSHIGTVISKSEVCVIVSAAGMNLWVDDDTQENFRLI